jgi:serine/threonine protein kinase
LVSELGSGGMGVVYRARQPSLDREVALKVLMPGDAKAAARFSREIHALGRVEHPHLVKVFTSGAEGTHWFYAMELIEGATLAAVCDKLADRGSRAAGLDVDTWRQALNTVCQETRASEEPLDRGAPAGGPREGAVRPIEAVSPSPPASRGYVRHMVELVRQVAEAAHALHEAGVIHRDIKPSNIMVSEDGNTAMLVDLGLAQLADDVEGRLTRTRQFVGTLRYASPEQVLAAGKLDRRSDVYSLGATLWELLTLRPIYGADEQTPPYQLMQRIQYEEPERLRKHHPAIAADLEAIILKCLEKNPNRRYSTAQELALDLRRWLRNEPVTAQRPTLAYVLGKYIRRHRLRFAVAAALLCATLIAAVAAFLGIDQARRSTQRGRTEEQPLVRKLGKP